MDSLISYLLKLVIVLTDMAILIMYYFIHIVYINSII